MRRQSAPSPAMQSRYYYYASSSRTAVPRRQVSPEQPPAPRRHRKPLIYLVIMAVVAGSFYGFWNQRVSAHELALSRARAATLAARSTRVRAAESQVQQLIAGAQGVTVSVNAQEIDPASPVDSVTVGTPGLYDAASVGKLITASDLLHQVDTHNASLGKTLDGKTLGQWLEPMVVNSDDTAWAELNGYLTHDDLNTYARSIGITNYNADDNQLSTADMTLLLRKLWQGNLLSGQSKSLLLSYMQRANYREYVMAAIPTGDQAYHKTGIDGDEVNDAVIISHGRQAIALVIMTDGNGTYNWPARAQLMQQIATTLSKAYFDTSQ